MATDETPEAARQDQIDDLLTRVQALKAQQKQVEADLADAMAELSEARDLGLIDDSFSFNDWSYSFSAGKLTTTYSTEAKAAIKRIQEADVISGNAQQKRGNAYWTIKPPAI
jgi:hypothetical protein